MLKLIFLLGIVCIILVILYSLFNDKTLEFKRRIKEIFLLYKFLEEVCYGRANLKTPFIYESNFYIIHVKNKKELAAKLIVMINDAINCYKQQTSISKLLTENMFSELFWINRKLIFIYTFA